MHLLVLRAFCHVRDEINRLEANVLMHLLVLGAF